MSVRPSARGLAQRCKEKAVQQNIYFFNNSHTSKRRFIPFLNTRNTNLFPKDLLLNCLLLLSRGCVSLFKIYTIHSRNVKTNHSDCKNNELKRKSITR